MPRKPKITKGPEEQLEFVEGDGWKACHDKKRELYTAESYVAGYYDLYEIGKDTYSRLKTERLDRRGAHELIGTGRHLYKSVSDRNGSYDIELDEDYAALCPWAEVQKTGELWGKELTDLAVTLFDSEEKNREQRMKRRTNN